MVKLEDLKSYLIGVLAEITAYFITKALDEMANRRRGTAKHMRRD